MKEETKKTINDITMKAYCGAANLAIKSAASAAFSVTALTEGDPKVAAAAAAQAIVMAPVSAATGVLLAATSVAVGSTMLMASTGVMTYRGAQKLLAGGKVANAAPAQN